MQQNHVARVLEDLVADAWGTGQDWWARFHETMREANSQEDARFGSISSREIGFAGRVLHPDRRNSISRTSGEAGCRREVKMPRLKLRRNRPSFSQMSSVLPSPVDPLSFIQSGRPGGSGNAREAYNQMLGAFHDVLADVERALSSVFERLRPEGNISDRMAMEANSEVRTELPRASTLADVKRNELQSGISFRLQAMFLQNLIMSPDQDPPLRRWATMADRAVQRDMPVVSEPSHSELDVNPKERRRRIMQWQMETDEWLEVLCLNRLGEVIASLLEEIGDYSASWTDTVNQLRRESMGGGRLFREVTDPEYWTFDNEDPTVKNLVTGVQAQEIATRILNRFQLSNMELLEICQQVHQSLGGRPVYGSDRVDILELENLLAEATAVKIKDTVAIDDGFLSLISSGTRSGEELGELLVEMRMGAAAMGREDVAGGRVPFGPCGLRLRCGHHVVSAA